MRVLSRYEVLVLVGGVFEEGLGWGWCRVHGLVRYDHWMMSIFLYEVREV
jgi:hypothetical protein